MHVLLRGVPVAKRHESVSAATKPIHAAGAAVCAVVLTAAVGLGVIPRLRAERADHDRMTHFEETKATLAHASEANAMLLDHVRNLREAVKSRQFDLTPSSGLNRRLAELTATLEDSGVTIELLQPGEEVTGGITPVIPIRMDVAGKLDQIYALLGVLDDENPDIHLESLALEYVGPGTMRLRTRARWLTAPE